MKTDDNKYSSLGASSGAGSTMSVKKKLIWTVLGLLLLYLLIDNQEVCKPHPSKPPTQYAIMLDAGSTGSRIHVYKFSYCNGALSPTLLDEVFVQLKPGLSSYPNDPSAAANSLNPLLDRAKKEIPASLRSCSPIALKATAGLRLLGTQKSDAILSAVRNHLEDNYPFPVADMTPGDGVSLMDGRDEGVYAWITVNYLTNRLGGGDKKPTAAIMDLGGGSTQIVFEPSTSIKVPDDPDYRYDLDFGNHKYVLYQHSYLGYGLMEGRNKVKSAAVDNASSNLPCLKQGEKMEYQKPHSAIKSILTGISDTFDQCKMFISGNLFLKDSCSLKPCSFDGIHQPHLDTSFPFDSESQSGDLYAFSYFYDRTRPFGLEDIFTVGDIKSLGDKVCSADPHKHFDKAILEQQDENICLDLGFIHGLLSTGYELPASRRLNVLKKIQGFETGWCLGAAIQLVDYLSIHKSSSICKPV